MLKIYLVLIVNNVCLFYVSYAQQLQLSHSVLVYEKQVVFLPKSGEIVVKINGVPHRTKQIELRQNLICHRKKNLNWRQVLTEFIVSNFIGGIKIKLI